MSFIEAVGHATSILLALGFIVFLWIIIKPLRKIRKRARKAHKRRMKYEQTRIL
jgi:uncharacterized BrkB/YihY/UPF0761 family membrane protein